MGVLDHSLLAKASEQASGIIRRVRKPPTDCSGPFAGGESFCADVLVHLPVAKASAQVFRSIPKFGKLPVDSSGPFTNGESLRTIKKRQ